MMNRIWEDHTSRYVFAAGKIKSGRTLDIACGEGYGSALLASYGHEVTGVDISEDTIKAAKIKYGAKKGKLSFVTSDVFEFLERNKDPYDAIISFETIEHLEEYKRFLILIKKNLKKTGVFLVSTPNKLFSDLLAGDKFNPFHVKEFYTEELISSITSVFGSKFTLYLQRPVKKDFLLFRAFVQFAFNKKSSIIIGDKNYEGLDNILVVTK
ncbi:MAG: hypothetical protein UT63_C0007G0027 [Candidatus Gottesmanbacteria bacterium GW2011_GWC2_39_8]|uniref:Methyltransferase domain-containing protein n=1 Tax=Candidatus Gottesmanbacteria bacterium GW2011_GWC2_39_8 TaxID=1618450 RepID=A0A0G0T850_9BACT|nr:MAG: hypothetical protein UT63_C0007G0027 [Candidatus Gottesmanbacteria bacterium GW2011_GWC2_39_8]